VEQPVNKWAEAAAEWDEEVDIAEREKLADEIAGVTRNPDDVMFMGSAQEPVNVEPEPEPLSQRDRARLLNNLPRDANRFVYLNGERLAILHMSVEDLESFRAFTRPLEEIMQFLLENETDFARYAIEATDLHATLFKHEVVEAAALALRMKTKKLKRIATPLALLNVVVEQWLHNLEIGWLRDRFPYPPDDDEETFTDEQLGIKGDPNQENPVAFAEGLCEKYHISLFEVRRHTVPHIYLLGCQAAWKAHRFKREMDFKEKRSKNGGGNNQGPKRRGDKQVYFDGKWQDITKMSRRDYASYMNEMLNKPYENTRG
jgi:hypothetical protein